MHLPGQTPRSDEAMLVAGTQLQPDADAIGASTAAAAHFDVVARQLGFSDEVMTGTQLAQSKVLDLTSKNLSALPKDIGRLMMLTKLLLKDNKLAELPMEMWCLANLVELHLETICWRHCHQELGTSSS